MNLKNSSKQDLVKAIQRTEWLFPQTFAEAHKRDWGILFATPGIPDSYDGNHACIMNSDRYPAEIAVEIKTFYKAQGLTPRVTFVSAMDNAPTLQHALTKAGFTIEDEEMLKMYLLRQPSRIIPNPDIRIHQVSVVDDKLLADLTFIENERMAKVTQSRTSQDDSWLFIGKKDGLAVSSALLERVEGMCRIDEVHTAESHRCKGYSRAVLHTLVNFYMNSGISEPLYLWPANQTAERIYIEAGFVKLDHPFYAWAAWNENK